MPGGISDVREVPSHFASEAWTSLRAVLDHRQTSGDLNTLVRVCHSLAVPYVSRRLGKDAILKETLHLSVRDFAYDCIADLFAFAETGEFPHFHAYFAAYPPESLGREEAVLHLRRLVFSHVNQGMFRLYNEVDPSLGRVLRNMKLALVEFPYLVSVDRFGEPCLVPATGDRLLNLRPLEPPELESGLSRHLRGNENIPYMLGKLALFLQEQDAAARVVPLMSAAIVFRKIYMKGAEDDGTPRRTEAELSGDDLKEVIRTAVNSAKTKIAGKYTGKKKITRELLDVYFEVIEKRLALSISGDGMEDSLYGLLREEMSDLTVDEYRKTHRSRLEYLARLTGKEVTRLMEVH